MERNLSQLFDYQRFVGNARIAGILREVESRYAGALSDDDLSFVNAAGDISAKIGDADHDE